MSAQDERSCRGHPDECERSVKVTAKYRGQIKGIVEAVVATRDETKGVIDHVGAAAIPSRASVIDILSNLEDVLFPGFFGQQELDPTLLPYHVGQELNEIFDRLADQIARSIRHECQRLDNLCVHCIDKGQREALEFLRKVPQLRRTLAGDVQALYDGDPAAKGYDEIVFSYPGLKAIAIYRIAHELSLQKGVVFNALPEPEDLFRGPGDPRHEWDNLEPVLPGHDVVNRKDRLHAAGLESLEGFQFFRQPAGKGKG